MTEPPFPSRTLAPREGAVVAWLEAERRPVVSVQDVAAVFPWPRTAIHDVLGRLTHKGWLRRTARGRYETILAETGGFAPPNPWAALSTWGQPYYVGLQSAAYEHGLTPDRPGPVQVAVTDVPITPISMRTFSLEGVEDDERHGVTVRLATPERVLVDAGALPGRVGGPQGLARIAWRAAPTADWSRVVELAHQRVGGPAALRRLAAILELVGTNVPLRWRRPRPPPAEPRICTWASGACMARMAGTSATGLSSTTSVRRRCARRSSADAARGTGPPIRRWTADRHCGRRSGDRSPLRPRSAQRRRAHRLGAPPAARRGRW
jgi:predicted transcriptional regulator of viral defense system